MVRIITCRYGKEKMNADVKINVFWILIIRRININGNRIKKSGRDKWSLGI